MKSAVLIFSILVSALATSWPESSWAGGTIAAPVLKWERGGCYPSYCETGWYASPALADVDKDGDLDVVAAAYSLTALDGKTGELIWRSADNSHRTWPGVVVADIDKDGKKEIVTAQAGGFLRVYGLNGQVKWEGQPTTSELRGVLAADLDGNGGKLEVVVTAAISGSANTWVYDSKGILRSGWPQLSTENSGNNSGFAWGVYNANAAAGNLDPRDAKLELAVPSDVHYINVYKPNGALLGANSTVYPEKNSWGQVGVWESLATEQQGFGACDGNRQESYRTNFAEGPAVIADLNRDGRRELIVTGNMQDCSPELGPVSKYTALHLFNRDRTRFKKGAFDWQQIPVDTGVPLSEDFDVIESALSNPVVADLDHDGRREILYAAYDGKMHAVWLDQQAHGSWPYSVYDSAEGYYRFASEPVVADLNRDGFAEVIFTSWVQKTSGARGKLHVLNYRGEVVHEVDLPAPFTGTWNGALAAPTLGSIDADRDLEVVINTVGSGVVAYDLPGTRGARVLWNTGRGGFTRAAAR